MENKQASKHQIQELIQELKHHSLKIKTKFQIMNSKMSELHDKINNLKQKITDGQFK